MGDKRKCLETFKKIRKKRKVDRSFSIASLIDDGYNMMFDKMEEVANERCKKMDESHIELVSSIIDLL